MKALMSVGALIGVVGLLMLIGMIFGVVPSNTVRLVEGYMPMQVLSELAIFVAGFTGLSYMLNVNGNCLSTILAGHFVLGVYPDLPQVPYLSTNSFQRSGDVWHGVVCRGVYVGIGE